MFNLLCNKLNQRNLEEILISNDFIDIYKIANNIRKQYKGDYVHIRALIEFSNICKSHCYYCGLRCENNKVQRYRLSEKQILRNVEFSVKSGYKTIVLQSGEDLFWDSDKLCALIKQIKKYDIAITLSIGERSYEEYKAFKAAGADRYLLRIETTDKNLYRELHPNMSFDNRINCLYNLKSLGYETGTGCIVGLPNQSIESLAQDIMFFKDLNADMVGIGPFIPHPDTPLADADNNNFDSALKVTALTRIVLPDINIPATTAMESLKPNGRITALNSGANVVMINVTDNDYKNKYEIYPNKVCLNSINDILAAGRKISQSKGFRKDKN